MTRPLRIVVSGAVEGAGGQGGAAWAVLQWVAGGAALGHEMRLVEELPFATPDRLPGIDEILRDASVECDAVAFESAAPPQDQATAAALDWLRNADLLINLAGTLRTPASEVVPRRLFVDLDPGYTQSWHQAGHDLGIERHTHHATVGLAIGRSDCPVPTLGIDWIHCLPPVDLARWQPVPAPSPMRLTTVGNWRSYGDVCVAGMPMRQKAHSMRELATLPSRAAMSIELAMAIHPEERADLEWLTREGWLLIDPQVTCARPSSYRSYIRGSAGEFGVTKHGYVASRCGWVSDRSACYLASGRPVVIADTGAGAVLDHDGIIRFDAIDSAADGIDCIARDWHRHSAGAIAFARSELDAQSVVGAIVERAMS